MTDRTILIASNNKGKIKEIKDILIGPPGGEASIPFEIKSLIDLGININIEESGNTFAENAILKAKIVGEKAKLLTIGEDSGLEVDALNGRPGILSARYIEGSDLDRINKLLKELKNIPKEKREARFKAVVAVYIPTMRGSIITFDGVSEGFITEKPMGKNGFGYDPIFFNLDLGKTNGEATLEEKNRVSHRARALFKAKKFFCRY